MNPSMHALLSFCGRLLAYTIFCILQVLFLSGPEKDELKHCLIDLGEHFQLARHLSHCDGSLAWHVKYKVHLPQHLYQQALLINPRFVQAYINESLIGFLRKFGGHPLKGRTNAKYRGR